ncbi:ferritin-like domain-containing protein [Antarcticibacterium sp. 1MA-6-2]|uniref:ferritin-like domain-containing protein n=1 Tax=Antarcticibacterium sp. 1MA-6-2 TaxID=2908210 RepID=UPI001F38BECB|nr:ferritin-like domain-containing protein [Antarcticibacterium sp. 1MA-6-2]UJH92127.1 ferritin-like domain-containing protein [Antarcticibacterium sp. 1MA-6-2]
MNIIKFLDEFTSESLTKKTASRREMFGTLGSLSKKAAMVAVPFGLASGSSKAFAAQDANSAVSALQLALTLEYLEAEFYMKALDSGVLPAGSKAEAIYMQISKHEDAHVDFLQSGLGDNSVESPEFDFTVGGMFDPFNENGIGQEMAYAQLLALAQAFEDTGVRAYKGQAGNLMGTQFLRPALQIHSVEARHASEIRRLRANVIGEDLNQNALGWITLDNRGPGMPEATQDVYNGEENVTQGGVNLVDATDFQAVAVSQAFDEPMSGETASRIAGLFIVNP